MQRSGTRHRIGALLDDRAQVFTETAIVTRSDRRTDAAAGKRRPPLDRRLQGSGKIFSNAL
jgi:hypothetical protein